MLRSLLWRLLRYTQDARSVSGLTGAGIERFSIFQGVLCIAGTIQTSAAVRELVLELAGGERHALPFSSASPGMSHFDATVMTAATPAEIAGSWLVARLTDGTEVQHHDLGAAVDDPAHLLAAHFRALLAERPSGHLLEIGSRARSGIVRRDWQPPGWTYSGFDIRCGDNVDVVGDAHVLSSHYPANSFDAVMAFSVLEHLLMPWKVVLEINRVLKPGAIGLFTTHQTWPLHDTPWDFWRFSDTAWSGLLNLATGFEIIDARLGEPAFTIPLRCSTATAFPEQPAASLASFVLFRKIGPTTLEWPVDLNAVLKTSYPTRETRV